MTKEQELLFKVIRESVSHQQSSDPNLNEDEWHRLFDLAFEQALLPLVYDSLHQSRTLMKVSKDARNKWYNNAIGSAVRQITQTNEFLTLIVHAQDKGLDPIVVKGVVCRNLYPTPCLRTSVDEDLLIMAGETEKYHDFLISEGLSADNKESEADEREKAYEISYHRENSPTYIELHNSLFDPNSDLFGELNRLFIEDPSVFDETQMNHNVKKNLTEGVFERSVRVQIEDVSVRTLAPTDHFLFLMLHAYKHFLHSGVGIRPMCDIGLFAEAYGDGIDWKTVRRKLTSVNAFYYARALLRIIEIYVLPGAEFFTNINDWNIQEINVEPLLEDLFAGGVHGASSVSRLHSSNMTLQAVQRRRSHSRESENPKAKWAGIISAPTEFWRHLLGSGFLPYENMKARYPYLKRAPFLLPAAWIQRIARYISEPGLKGKEPGVLDSASASVRIGQERIKLLEQYHIIKKN